jgi:hypothetical protein
MRQAPIGHLEIGALAIESLLLGAQPRYQADAARPASLVALT